LAASVIAALYLERRPPRDAVRAVEQIEKRLEEKRRPKWLEKLRAACSTYDCACVKTAAGFGLDTDANDAVLALVEKASSCPSAGLGGFRAEALVRKGDGARLGEAVRLIEQSPRDPNALYARALLAYRARDFGVAMQTAESSERAGRGWSAKLLVGLIANESGDLERARHEFRSLLKGDPNDVDALWNVAVMAQKQGRYGEARKAYLEVTRLWPGHADARHNLALLAHSIGAMDEAQHHAQKFRASGAPAERVTELEAALARAPANPPAQVISFGTPSSPGVAAPPVSASP
jgi:Flp pilus assembly protein TadD